jgi:hypothetical protein
MEIKIKDADEEVWLSNEELDNNNFIELTVINKLSDDDIEEMTTTISIEDLYAAVKTFYNMRTRRQNWDNNIK